jgi:hypothetical protein
MGIMNNGLFCLTALSFFPPVSDERKEKKNRP